MKKKEFDISDKHKLIVKENTSNDLDTYFTVKHSPIHSHTFYKKHPDKEISGVVVSHLDKDNRHPQKPIILDSSAKIDVSDKDIIKEDEIKHLRFFPLSKTNELAQDTIIRTQSGGINFDKVPILTFEEFDSPEWATALIIHENELCLIGKKGSFHRIVGLIDISNIDYMCKPLKEVYPQIPDSIIEGIKRIIIEKTK
ncbi:MAG: hypothetical protein NTY48_03905 [Candidatus Diapherotrites archaeon]|nr:hypothetical protein [Candidatus Diapherotrites archaeon]